MSFFKGLLFIGNKTSVKGDEKPVRMDGGNSRTTVRLVQDMEVYAYNSQNDILYVTSISTHLKFIN